MGVDLFVAIEKIFQGTVLFFFKLFHAAFCVATSPVKGTVGIYNKFKDNSTAEIGPVTFFVISFLVFWSAVLSLTLLSRPLFFNPDVVTSQLKALDASPLRIPLILVCIAAATTTLLVDLLLRTLTYVLMRFGAWSTPDGPDSWRAIYLYTAGVSALLFPTLWLVVLLVYLTNSKFVLESIDLSWLVGMSIVSLLLSPIFHSAASAYFVSRVWRSRALSRLSSSMSVFFCSYVGLGMAFFLTFVLIRHIAPALVEGTGPMISSLSCKMSNRDRSTVVAVVAIRNGADRPEVIDTSRWQLAISERLGTKYLASEGQRSIIEGQINPPFVLLKPHSVVYGTIFFPVRDNNLPGPWINCEVWNYGGHSLRFKQEMTFIERY